MDSSLWMYLALYSIFSLVFKSMGIIMKVTVQALAVECGVDFFEGLDGAVALGGLFGLGLEGLFKLCGWLLITIGGV